MINLHNNYFLPDEATFTGEGLLWGEQKVCNFLPIVTKVVESVSEDGTENFIHIKCLFSGENDGENGEITVRLSQLETINWFNLDNRCLIDPDCTRANKYLAAIIRASLATGDIKVVKEYSIGRLGMHSIEGSPVFCVGDELISSPIIVKSINEKSINIKLDSIPSKLAIDEQCSELEAAKGMMRVVNLSPKAGIIIFVHCLLNIMRTLYAEVHKAPHCIVFLVGKTGTKKTTYAAFMTQMYDRDKGIQSPLRLNSSAPAFEQILHDTHDCVVLLDDLFPAQSSETRRKQEKTLIDLTRIVGDDSGRAIKSGNNVVAKEPKCGVMVTGEYLIGTGSDAARLLPITLTTPIDNAKLAECQNKPLIVSTFYKFFIEWFIEKYSFLRSKLPMMLDEYRSTHMGVHDRLQETHFHLSSAYRFFLCYCIDKGFTTPKSATAQYNSFRNQLTALVKQQDQRVRMSGGEESAKTDYLNIIRTLYKGGVFRLADDIAIIKDKHHGLIHEGCLCLRSMKLMPEILKLVPNANLNAVIASLQEQDALKTGSDRSSIQISGGGGKRFLAVPLRKLK